ncbi:hypothetical protein V3C99_012087 [Haemonchus contortus]
MNSAERREYDLDFTGPPPKILFDFHAIRIRVYKNGDERDPGKLITITRREYKHWIIFLDALTRKLGTTTAINRLYSVDGIRVNHFAELEHNGEYVAVERGPFIDCNYGAYRIWTQTEKKWTSLVRVTEGKPVFLDSGDSMDLYLKKQGYGSTTGLPYPLDGLSRSPNASASQLCEDKIGGSSERLHKAGEEMWNEQNHSVSMSNIQTVGDAKEKSVMREQSLSVTRLPRLLGIEDNPRRNKGYGSTRKEKEVDRLPLIQQPTDTQKSTKDELKKGGLSEEVRSSVKTSEQPSELEKKEEAETKRNVKEYSTVDQPMSSWQSIRPGTVYEKKEMMHEIISEGAKPTLWREKQRRNRAEKMTEVVRTYEKIREYRRFIDEYDPDFVD